MKAHVYKITLMIIDFENMGEEQVTLMLEQHKHLAPLVRDCEQITVDWEDDNPLNQKGWRGAFDASFEKGKA